MITYAIGDIHGCADELYTLLGMCERDARGRDMRIIFLGDYVDRGPDSRSVIRLIRAQASKCPTLALRGNHDEMLWRGVLDHDVEAEDWTVSCGGLTTLKSYGIDLVDGASDFANVDIHQRLRECAQLQNDCIWLKHLTLWHDDRHGRRFVHAGIDPTKLLADQSEHDALWTRSDAFLEGAQPFERYIVHGHTYLKGVVDVRTNRCNVDSGCVYGHKLSAAVFDESQLMPVRVLSTNRQPQFNDRRGQRQ